MSKLKNVFLLCLFVLFLGQIIGVFTANVSAQEITYGDVNGDGNINSIDFAFMRQHILGIIKDFDNPNGIKTADVDGNGAFNAIDFALMRKYILGYIDSFPATRQMSTVIDADTVLGKDISYTQLTIINGAVLDLNGHTLSVAGDFTQNESVVNVNGGKLEVGRNYLINEKGMLQMTNEADYVYVGGDFKICNGENNLGVVDNNLTAGVMEVKGDFYGERDGYNFGRYIALGSHKVILSGDTEQIVYNDSGWLVFNQLEIKNEAGVRFECPIGIRAIKGSKILGGTIAGIESIFGDVTVDGDLLIVDSNLHLSGYELVISGDFVQTADYCANVMDINGGKLTVLGDYIIKSERYTNYYSKLRMINESDYVYVGGDFITYCGSNNLDMIDDELTAGVMEVKGDFYCERDDWHGFGQYIAGGTHKVILSGDDEQTVYNDSGWLVFNQLEIKNEVGVRFDFDTPINIMRGNYKVLDVAVLNIGSIADDVVIDGNLTIRYHGIDLAGHSFEVNGDFRVYSDTPLKSELQQQVPKIKINEGSLKVNGNYIMGYDEENLPEPEWYYGSILDMSNEQDYVYVGGDFIMASAENHMEYLTAGVLEVKGDFTQAGYAANFAASGTHKTILSGEEVQNVTFENPRKSSFNILSLTKPLDTGYIFNETPVWKTLEQ